MTAGIHVFVLTFVVLIVPFVFVCVRHRQYVLQEYNLLTVDNECATCVAYVSLRFVLPGYALFSFYPQPPQLVSMKSQTQNHLFVLTYFSTEVTLLV